MKLILTRTAILACACLPSFFILINKASAQTTMFRGPADHNYTATPSTGAPFTDLAWKFNASAPIQSTVAATGGALLFGSSKGMFYSLSKLTGKLNWSYNTGSAINSSAAVDKGNVFFSDNRQALYSLNAMTGKLNWKTGLGVSKNYDWAFDYYYSSPSVAGNQIFIGSKDGCLYNINETTGHINWKFKTGGVVRSSPAVSGGVVYVGDTDGSLFAIDAKSGKQLWRFLTTGNGLKNENFGFDRRAIIAAPVVAGNKVIVGGRDGFLYAIDKTTGKELWRVNHQVSWVISAVAIKGNTVVTGTSDGHFVQAIDINTGKQLWKYVTTYVVWSSPIIDGNRVYACNNWGMLYCLDLKTGAKINTFQTEGAIYSSPVISGSLLYFGCDDGYLYALKPGATREASPLKAKKYVYWDSAAHYYKYGTDIRIKQYLTENGYTLLDKQKLTTFLKTRIAQPTA